MIIMTGFAASAHATTDAKIPPSIEFLEYLAELVEVDGKLYGPQDLDSIKEKDAQTKADKTSSQKSPAKNEVDKPSDVKINNKNQKLTNNQNKQQSEKEEQDND